MQLLRQSGKGLAEEIRMSSVSCSVSVAEADAGDMVAVEVDLADVAAVLMAEAEALCRIFPPTTSSVSMGSFSTLNSRLLIGNFD